MTAETENPFAALHRDLSAIVPIRLFTVTTVERNGSLARRLYTSHPDDYPVTGTKPIISDGWSRHVLENRQTFVANRTDEFAPYFPDHALINALGCQSAVNIPVVAGDEVVATVNLLDVEDHFTPARVAMLEALVASRAGDIAALVRPSPD